MAANSKIGWTHHTFNPWWGCTKVSPGCAHCFAKALAKRFGFPIWGDDAPRRYFQEHHFDQLTTWDCRAAKTGKAHRVFVGSICDWAEGRQEQLPHLALLFNQVERCLFLDFLLLTKRPHYIRPILKALVETQQAVLTPDTRDMLLSWLAGHPPRNVWLLASVENQETADRRIGELLEVPAVVHGLSAEPLLAPVNLRLVGAAVPPIPSRIDWVICGGESGPGARPMHPDWARSLRDQCSRAGVPFFFKQWGEWAPATLEAPDRLTIITTHSPCPRSPEHHNWEDGTISLRVGKRAAGRLLDNQEHSAFPTLAPTLNPES